MSIIQELNTTKNNLRAARKSILARGGELSMTAGLKDLPNAIYNIPANNSLNYQEDNTIAYRKIVPSSAKQYARIGKVGGMSYRILDSKNLFRGITLTSLEGWTSVDTTSISRTGWEGDSIWGFGNVVDAESLFDGSLHYFKVFGAPSTLYVRFMYQFRDDEGNSIDGEHWLEPGMWFDDNFQGSSMDCIIMIDGSFPYVEDGMDPQQTITLQFMISNNSDDEYEPVIYKLYDTPVTELVSQGANLIPFPYVGTKGVGYTVTQNGVTFTVLEDGGVQVTGTATESTYFDLCKIDFGEQTLMSGSTNNKITVTDCGYNSRNKITSIDVYKGKTVNKIFYPMINRGATAAPYKPYRADAVDRFPISSELRSFLEPLGYGKGVNASYYNYIDFERKVFVQRTYGRIFDGTEVWQCEKTDATGHYRFYTLTNNAVPLAVNNSSIPPIICNHYGAVSSVNGWYGGHGVSTDANYGGRIYIFSSEFTTAEDFTAHLAKLKASGHPVVVEYALAEPIEIDISAYLTDDNFIEVESGGTITAVNTHNYAVPTTINYITQVV